MNPQEAARTGEQPLESWKEIGAYLQRDATTVRRWEKKEGLPVHRHAHQSGRSVYAYPSEIDAWRASRKVAAEPAPIPPWPWWRRLAMPGFALTMALSLIMAGSGGGLQVVEAEEGQTRSMICSGPDCDSGQISPDGKSLVAIGGSGIVIRSLATRQSHKLLPDTLGGAVCCFIFSPDASRVAFTWRPPAPGPRVTKAIAEAMETRVANADGSGSRMVFRGGGPAAWSPDGKRLLVKQFTGDEGPIGLAWVDVAGGMARKLPVEHLSLGAATVSPDGHTIGFNARKAPDSAVNVFVVSSDGSGESVVSPSAASQQPLGWDAEGKSLIYAEHESSFVSLWAVPVAHGQPQGPAINTHVQLDKDANIQGMTRSGALYYRTVTNISDVYTAMLDSTTSKVTSAPTPVPAGRTGQNVLPRWAPDSNTLLFAWADPVTPNGRPSDNELSTYSIAIGKVQRLAQIKQANSNGYCWAPDGNSIVLNTRERGAPLVRFNLSNGETTTLVTGAAFGLRTCAGELALGLDSQKLKVRNLQTGSEKEIYTFNTPPPHPPVISHDGRSVAFAEQMPDGSVLRVISIDAGPTHELTTVPAPVGIQSYWGVAWSADDRFIYFARRPDKQSPYELFRISVAGGRAESVGLKAEDLRDLNISPDGSRIAFSLGAVNRPEIWAIRGLLSKKK